MLHQDYLNQFNIKPTSELEAYCKWEGVSLPITRKSYKSRAYTKKLRIAAIFLGTVFAQWMDCLAAGFRHLCELWAAESMKAKV